MIRTALDATPWLTLGLTTVRRFPRQSNALSKKPAHRPAKQADAFCGRFDKLAVSGDFAHGWLEAPARQIMGGDMANSLTRRTILQTAAAASATSALVAP